MVWYYTCKNLIQNNNNRLSKQIVIWNPCKNKNKQYKYIQDIRLHQVGQPILEEVSSSGFGIIISSLVSFNPP